MKKKKSQENNQSTKEVWLRSMSAINGITSTTYNLMIKLYNVSSDHHGVANYASSEVLVCKMQAH